MGAVSLGSAPHTCPGPGWKPIERVRGSRGSEDRSDTRALCPLLQGLSELC